MEERTCAQCGKYVKIYQASIKPRLKISIFSRAAAPNYEWLVEWLKDTCTMGPVDVHAVRITNDHTKFYSELPNCSFAILYHTLNQGRLNVTDVTDSVYNEELGELSKQLGQKNVIVILDDLQKTSPDEKKRILDSQPSIGRLARDLYLFNNKKKSPENLENIRRILMEKAQNSIAMDIGIQDGLSYKSTSSWSSNTTGGKGQELSSACRDRKGSGEPESKKFLPNSSIWSPHSGKAVSDSAFEEAYLKSQDCQRKMQEEFRAVQRVNEELRSENNRLRKDL
ncbi:hypothetical protein PRIEUP_LOCUS423 [Pristimantis euphronides]